MARGTELHAKMEQVEFSDQLPKPEGFVELWRERAFEVFADGEWISGRFDRVTFFKTPEGLSAEIVDFKSSLAHPERSDGQLAAYRRAVAALTGIPPERIAARLVVPSRNALALASVSRSSSPGDSPRSSATLASTAES